MTRALGMVAFDVALNGLDGEDTAQMFCRLAAEISGSGAKLAHEAAQATMRGLRTEGVIP